MHYPERVPAKYNATGCASKGRMELIIDAQEHVDLHPLMSMKTRMLYLSTSYRDQWNRHQRNNYTNSLKSGHSFLENNSRQ